MESKPKPLSNRPIFVPKKEPEVPTVEISLDDALNEIKKLRAQKKELESTESNLVQIVKDMMAARSLRKYSNPLGVSAGFYSSQRSTINKELAKTLCGEKWAEVESFTTTETFMIK
jgi:hypothetical protein